ncbi:MAG: response regulator transcription factor [Filimonas sp.]|nr:response regulator transcription factor [Filimonas sp.]
MEKINCLIVEDEPLAAEILQDYIAQVPHLVCKGVCRDAIYAMRALQDEQIDVLFLDIHLPKIKGLDFLLTLSHPPQVIITTAYRDYALDAFDLSVVDYLLKPISFNRFLKAVNKLKGSTLAANTEEQPEPAHLLININKKKVKILLSDILFIESKKEYVTITTAQQSFTTKHALTDMEQTLPANKFLRVHRSFIVSKDKVTAFTATTIEMTTTQIPIGRSYREITQQALART